MGSKTKFGIGGTTLWVVVVGVFASCNWDAASKLTLNEWGDFIAGVTAPVAFFWLILGYFQQGEELRLNTQALAAQERELSLQVEETRKLVQQSTIQAQASRELLLLEIQKQVTERLEAEAREQPVFRNDRCFGVGEHRLAFDFVNDGGPATSLSIAGEDNFPLSIEPTESLDRLQSGEVRVAQSDLRSGRYFRIKYTDRFTANKEKRFIFQSSQHGGMKFTEVPI